MHDAFDAAPKMRHVEIDQKSNFKATQFEVSQHLRDVKREEFFNSLQFDNDAVLGKKVDAIPSVNLNVVIKDGQSHLMIEADAILPQLISQTCVVGARDLFVQHLIDNLRFLLSSVVESLRTGGWLAICSPPVL